MWTAAYGLGLPVQKRDWQTAANPVKGSQGGEGLEHTKYERLRWLGVFSLNKRKVKGNLTAVFHCLMVEHREGRIKFFSKVTLVG